MLKRYRQIINRIQWIDSIVGFLGIALILGAALFTQFFEHEQPCPLCLLQRAALINIGIAFLYNMRYSNKACHWALAILSACAGIAVSIRQILLHITTPQGFANPIFGLHLYTWCFIIFAATIIISAIMLLIYPEKR